ncbi:hypothetical protein A9G08_04560 [Gilliamella sp. wkB195]|uniref:phage tail protein n=1 Tax=Gilliamella sp. wkB195 TaxID=3120261 RepID=UPI00080DD8BC|nr:phage tail protein [Gilliamella apicola]OCG00181.1 hypothetical protein A9G08_04560 [Gilliamella apicola]
MSQTYYTILTKLGAELLANATALGIPLKLTSMAVGDGNGSAPKPTATQTALTNEVRRAAINSLSVDKNNSNQIIAEQVIPENEGGWFIHEIGLFDDRGNLIAVGNCPPTYKPRLAEGSGRTQVIRMIIIIDNIDSVELKIDPSVVLATREYVDEKIETRVPPSRKINNKKLDRDVILNADDINALPAQKKINAGAPIYEVGKNVSTGYRVGEQWLSAYRFNELPFGCYFRNGDNYLLDSPQGRVLNSFSNNYKHDHGITIKTINGKQYINVPTAFAPDGRGYFERAVDGTTRQVGSVQPDAIRNIYGEIIFHGDTADGSYPAVANGVFSGIHKKNSFRYGQLNNEQISFGGIAFNAENFVPTGPENTVLNIGRTPVIYLGV